MAKRRRLNAPTAEELAKITEGFAAKPDSKRPSALGVNVPPIARVAGEAAAHSGVKAADARRYQAAKDAGLLAQKIPLAQIKTEHLSRDRMQVDEADMAELKHSILAHGLRMPIEVLPLEAIDGGPRYGLISGWRRVAALRALAMETGREDFASIPALIRAPKEASDAYISMVEENEIRADLSHFERGRIAVISTKQGAFETVENAVNALFAAGSKAKRSKIRSFALIFEALGDLLQFPTRLSERAGLRIAAALKEDQTPALRAALANSAGLSFEDEWRAMEGVLKDYEALGKKAKAERRAPKPTRYGEINLANGIKIEKINGEGYIDIRFTGRQANNELVDTVMLEIQRLLELE